MTSFRLPQSWHHKTKHIAKEGPIDPNLPKQESLWTKSFIIIAVMNFLISASGKMVDIVFPFYIHELGGDNIVVGIVSGLCAFFALLMRPLAGWFLDNISRKSIFIAALIAMLIIPLTYRFLPTLILVVAVRCLHTLSWSAASTSSNTNACDIIPRSRFGEGMGWFGLTNSLATAAAPAFGLFIMNKLGIKPLFIVCTVVAAVLLLMLPQVKLHTIERRQKTNRGVPLLARIGNLFNKNAVPAAMFTFLVSVPAGGIFTFLALFFQAENMGSAGLFFALQAIFTGVSRILSGKMADKLGEGPFVYISVVCFLGSIFMLAFGQTVILFYASGCLMGLGFGLFIPAMQAMAVRIVPINRRGSASSTFLCAWDISFSIGGMLGGFLSELCGFRMMFAILSVFVLVAVAYYFFIGRKAPSAFKVYQANLAAEHAAKDNL